MTATREGAWAAARRALILLVGAAAFALLVMHTAFSSTPPTFQPKVDYPTGSSPSSVAIGDLNGDGKPDLAVANLTTVSVLLGNGNGTFQPRWITRPASAASRSQSPT